MLFAPAAKLPLPCFSYSFSSWALSAPASRAGRPCSWRFLPFATRSTCFEGHSVGAFDSRRWIASCGHGCCTCGLAGVLRSSSSSRKRSLPGIAGESADLEKFYEWGSQGKYSPADWQPRVFAKLPAPPSFRDRALQRSRILYTSWRSREQRASVQALQSGGFPREHPSDSRCELLAKVSGPLSKPSVFYRE